MSDPRRGQLPVSELDQTGQEFLDAQVPKSPVSVGELKQATESSARAVEAVLGDTSTFDEWIELSVDLEELFLEEADGVLGKKLIELSALDETAFTQRREEAEAIVKQSADTASRLYPLVHRLQTLGFASNREETVRKLSVGDLITTEKVHGVSIVPVRTTVIGLLRSLDKRLGSNIWSLEYPPQIPPTVVVTDPFDAHATEAHWKRLILTKREMFPDDTHSILTISGDKTIAIAWELENILERTDDKDFKQAATVLVEFLNHKALYYQDPDPRDFELYHLGMEQPEDLMNVFRSLDTIKHKDPELFLEILGVNPEDGGRSSYFGSFLHKAIYNTQMAIERAGPELGELAIRTMMKQLMTMSAHVKTYAGVVSQESLKALAGEMKKRLEGMKGEERGKMLTMMTVPFLPLAIDAEVRRQLEAMRESNIETLSKDLKRRIEDFDHPLKLLEYIASMPEMAISQPEIRKQLEQLYPKKRIDGPLLQKLCRERDLEILLALYDRIPLVDETKLDLGVDHLIKSLVDDSLALEGRFARAGIFATKQVLRYQGKMKKALSEREQSLYNTIIMEEEHPGFQLLYNYLHRRCLPEDFLQKYFSQRTILERRFLDAVQKRLFRAREFPSEPIRPDDRAYLLGQTFVELINKGEGTKDIIEQNADKLVELVKSEKENSADVVFLSMLAHPNGAKPAFGLFATFCGLIPSERMYQLLQLEATQAKNFEELFWAKPTPLTAVYVEYVRRAFISHLDGPERLQWDEAKRKTEMYSKLNRVLIEKVSPLTFSLTNPEHVADKIQVDLFDLAQAVYARMYKEHFGLFSHELLLKIQKTLYELPEEQKTYIHDKLVLYTRDETKIEDVVNSLISVMTNKYMQANWPIEIKEALRQVIRGKIKFVGYQNEA